MPLTMTQKADFVIAEFDTELTIFNVREAHSILQAGLAKAPDRLILDVTALQDLDSAGLQLLLWTLAQVRAPAQAVISAGDNPQFSRVSDLYAVQWPTHFTSQDD
ncbi:anti-sigma factor antagonist [Rheinheimera riviphila]|uniref:Anti-sigma factor antagonist n=1 Tax=Rheinheimera riviphila TaxID=1834037 RepID=A0A437QSQ0_9GAMM|nr:STAS domain-containing protein [Rheinheimera riviphila]RVU37543.1 anti-sigma factor antagonist [Rheinheimera riviphila]